MLMHISLLSALEFFLLVLVAFPSFLCAGSLELLPVMEANTLAAFGKEPPFQCASVEPRWLRTCTGCW